MKKHFYSHIIEVDTVYSALDTLDLQENEKEELKNLMHSSIYHLVVDLLLSELTESDKKKVLAYIAKEKHDELWKLLSEKIDDVEGKIKKAVDEFKSELHADIKEAKLQKE